MIKRNAGEIFVIVLEDATILTRASDIPDGVYPKSAQIFRTFLDATLLELVLFVGSGFSHPAFEEVEREVQSEKQ